MSVFISKPKLSKAILAFAYLFIVVVGLVHFFKSEQNTLNNEVRFIETLPYRGDVYWAAQNIFNIFCIRSSSDCEISIVDKSKNILAVAPLDLKKNPSKGILTLQADLSGMYDAPLALRVRYTPSFSHIINYIVTVALLMCLLTTVILLFQSRINTLEVQKKIDIAELAQQVAHDIRSPLSALNAIISRSEQLPENEKALMTSVAERINNIANGLISNTKNITTVAREALIPLLGQIISEKSYEYANYKNVQIIFDELPINRDIYVSISSLDFKRIISNLINNSVEAISDKTGIIKVKVCADRKNVKIIIQDNGCGMPNEVLKKLGKIKISYGKQDAQSGSGIGVYHAMRVLTDVRGRLDFKTSVENGTTAEITLPLSPEL